MPEFYIGPYREFMTDVRKHGKIGLVVLVCGEHEDDEEFKRDVVCDPEFVKIIKDKDILIWGADVRSREGYQGEWRVDDNPQA
jgi:FAS-associated factor 2